MEKKRAVREPLSRQRILEAAVRLVDAEGLNALTMRRLASELGVEGASLYKHIPNKAALNFYEAVRREGTQKNLIDTLQTRAELYDFLGYHEYEEKLDALFALDK